MPVSVGDSTTFHRALMATSMADVMQFCQRGMVDYTFLSGAQVIGGGGGGPGRQPGVAAHAPVPGRPGAVGFSPGGAMVRVQYAPHPT